MSVFIGQRKRTGIILLVAVSLCVLESYVVHNHVTMICYHNFPSLSIRNLHEDNSTYC